ncbi:hypothetical protein PUT78_18035 [Roseinatronobacter sp. HJB301]|uniref:Addiction module killer protein n=1 Tax=Roseinatronobacter alkalisoli TaxID=3028235 RepID=A0ABT5TCY6_9RHOB|nr:type II toxin-antitoxin system RelE/ParE family toxin [Roseinatronobacter sp. HJB301]MDD7972987.1 hypothetical protein [Roseinatronobacter sp. HJB301]
MYTTEDGKAPFTDWSDCLDTAAALKFRTALARIETGNLGDVKPVGQGVSERRIMFGPDYRVYFGQDGGKLVILLCGGLKARVVQIIGAAPISAVSRSTNLSIRSERTARGFSKAKMSASGSDQSCNTRTNLPALRSVETLHSERSTIP